MTKTESAHLTAQTVLIESAEQVLQLHSGAGVRLAIPDTDALIMVGTQEWIAKNVPGVEAMVEGAPIVTPWEDRESLYENTLFSQVERMEAEIAELRTRLAATTQASTAQAEPVAWMRMNRQECKTAAAKAFMENADWGHWRDVAASYTIPLYAGPVEQESATSSTDAQAAPTDISQRLREYAGNPGYSHNDYADTMRAAAEEIERYYGGMMAWKRTAEKKDRDWNEARMARENDRCAARADAQAAAEVRDAARFRKLAERFKYDHIANGRNGYHCEDPIPGDDMEFGDAVDALRAGDTGGTQ